MSNVQKETPTKVILENVRFSYVHVHEAVAIGTNADKKFSSSIIINKSNLKAKKDIDEACAYLINEVKSKNKGKLPANFKMPLRDGDAERPEDEAYENAWFLNASSKTKPGLVDAKKKPITDQDLFYSGCYGYVSLNFYLFDTNGNKGIACGLNNIMKTDAGEPLSGRASAEQDFANIETEDEGQSLLG